MYCSWTNPFPWNWIWLNKGWVVSDSIRVLDLDLLSSPTFGMKLIWRVASSAAKGGGRGDRASAAALPSNIGSDLTFNYIRLSRRLRTVIWMLLNTNFGLHFIWRDTQRFSLYKRCPFFFFFLTGWNKETDVICGSSEESYALLITGHRYSVGGVTRRMSLEGLWYCLFCL